MNNQLRSCYKKCIKVMKKYIYLNTFKECNLVLKNLHKQNIQLINRRYTGKGLHQLFKNLIF